MIRSTFFSLALASACALAHAQAADTDRSTAKPKSGAAAKHKKKAVKKKQPPAPAVLVLPAAEPEQLAAAERVFYGTYQCEFKQTLDVSLHPQTPGYADVKFKNKTYTMKPVLSSTGAVRLEEISGGTLMIQIARKSMLLDVKAGQRLVDECVHEKQLAPSQTAAAAAAASEPAAAGAAASSAAP